MHLQSPDLHNPFSNLVNVMLIALQHYSIKAYATHESWQKIATNCNIYQSFLVITKRATMINSCTVCSYFIYRSSAPLSGVSAISIFINWTNNRYNPSCISFWLMVFGLNLNEEGFGGTGSELSSCKCMRWRFCTAHLPVIPVWGSPGQTNWRLWVIVPSKQRICQYLDVLSSTQSILMFCFARAYNISLVVHIWPAVHLLFVLLLI